jgi:hypothetical protein
VITAQLIARFARGSGATPTALGAETAETTIVTLIEVVYIRNVSQFRGTSGDTGTAELLRVLQS